MRTELERIQLIEKYLEGNLNQEQQIAFNQELKENPQFKNEIESQKRILEGVQRTAFKTNSLKQFKLFNRKKNVWKWGLGGALTIAVLAIAIPIAVETTSESTVEFAGNYSDSLFTITPSATNYAAEAENFAPLTEQVYNLSTATDTVITTAEGIVFAIPNGSFVNEDGEKVVGEVELHIKEAMNADQIMSAGLTTTSNGKLLETDGMFYISASQDGEQLQLRKEIHAEVPTNDYQAGMQLFDGVRQQDGSINWINPQKIENWITPVEITELNFYPPGFEELLKELGYGSKSKAWKDSLYLSFSNETPTESIGESDSISTDLDESTVKGIDPASVLAIWNGKFNNTNLATKEFEERLQVIFTSCNPELLEVYTQNLDRDFSELDSIAAVLAEGSVAEQFELFAARKDGRVNMEKGMVKKLSKFYKKQQRKLKKEAAALQNKYQEEQQKAREKYGKLQKKEAEKALKAESQNLVNELNLNLREVNRQLGIKPCKYKVVVRTLGAKNIDKYVEEVLIPTINSTINRSSTSIQYNGKTAQITYTPVFINIDNKEQYDRVYCYLLSDKLYSFQRMKDSINGFTEKLNEFMEYNCAVVGYKGDSVFFGGIPEIKTTDPTIQLPLQSIGKKELKTKLDQLAGGKKKSFKKDILEHQEFELKKENELARSKSVKEMMEFRANVSQVVFPCDEGCSWVFDTWNQELRPSKFEDITFGITLYKNAGIYTTFDGKYTREDNGIWKFNKSKTAVLLSYPNKQNSIEEIQWLNPFSFNLLIHSESGIDSCLFIKKCDINLM